MKKTIKLLLVDDEDDFRRVTSKVLVRRGFEVQGAESGERALELLQESIPDVVILDLKMGGMSGIATLSALRKIAPELPVIILTGHGSAEDAFAGIRLEIVDFLKKPVDIDKLAVRIRGLISGGRKRALREKSLRDLAIPPSAFQSVHEDDPLDVVVRALQRSLQVGAGEEVIEPAHRTVLVYSRRERFLGVIRLEDVLRLVVPSYLELPQSSYFTGMFLAELKTLGRQRAGDLLAPQASVLRDSPLMEAVHLLVSRRVTSVAVMHGRSLVGLVTDRAIFQEIAASVLGEESTAAGELAASEPEPD